MDLKVNALLVQGKDGTQSLQTPPFQTNVLSLEWSASLAFRVTRICGIWIVYIVIGVHR